MLELLPRTWEMWRFGGLSVFAALRDTWVAFKRNGLDGRSAQSAYYGIALVPPTLFLLITALAALPLDGVFDAMASDTERALPADAYAVLVKQLDGIRTHQSSGFFGLAVGVFLLSGMRLFTSMSRALNTVHGVEERRRFWAVWGVSLLLGFGSFVMLLASAMLLFFGPLLELPFSGGLRLVITIGVALLAISVIYWAMPSVRQRWMPLTPGNALAVGAWLLFSLGFRVFVENFGNYNETYGALAGVILMMIWMHLSGVAFYYGAQLNAVILAAMGSDGAAPPLRGRP